MSLRFAANEPSANACLPKNRDGDTVPLAALECQWAWVLSQTLMRAVLRLRRLSLTPKSEPTGGVFVCLLLVCLFVCLFLFFFANFVLFCAFSRSFNNALDSSQILPCAVSTALTM